MPLHRLDEALRAETAQLNSEGRAKLPERIIVGYRPADGKQGPRYLLEGNDREFLRMNSNSYLSLSNHPKLIEAADVACRKFGVGPGAVRFIDGTFRDHILLEERIARFLRKPAAKIFNSAYTANLGLALTIHSSKTFWIGDELNHNSIIRAMRICNAPRESRAIFKHNDARDLQRCLKNVRGEFERAIVIFDGIFSMRGDHAPLKEIAELAKEYDQRFKDGVVTVMDDSHGIGAYGITGRGTEEVCNSPVDIIVGTFGKAFGVNGGFIAGSKELMEAVRQKADTYIYTNPLGVADCAAAVKATEFVDSAEGRERLAALKERTEQFRRGLSSKAMESIPGIHPIVPVLVRDTDRTRKTIAKLYDEGLLAVGLTFPVVPRGQETIRFQINAAHTEDDVDFALRVLSKAIK